MTAAAPIIASVTTECSSYKFTFSADDLQVLIDQVMSCSHTTVMSAAISGNTWLFDTACGNHMISYPSLFKKILPVSNGSITTTANGSTLKAIHVGNVDTSNVYIPNSYLVPNLASQLCHLGLHLHVSKQYGCIVQDP